MGGITALLSQAVDGVSGWGGDFLGFAVNQGPGRGSLSVPQSRGISPPGERGTAVSWLGWGPGTRHRGPGRALLSQASTLPSGEKPGGLQRPSSPLHSPCRASQPGGSQGPLLPRELLCGLGGTTCERGASLSPPPCSRGAENGPGLGWVPGSRQDPTSHLRALRVPLLPWGLWSSPGSVVLGLTLFSLLHLMRACEQRKAEKGLLTPPLP